MGALPLETYTWADTGYQPLVFSHDWQVALLNWEPPFDLDRLGEIERHNHTDEVFVLVKGSALLFAISEDGQMRIADMQPGVVHNVTKGSWHGLVATRDVQIIIIENRDTHLHDNEFRFLSSSERQLVFEKLPTWVKNLSEN
jgi:mannose-6-phosphate isomerase-like protein (cupin superfamily)